MGEIIGLILLTISSIVTLVAMLVLLPALIPNKVSQAQIVLQQSPGRSFVIGLVNFIFFFVIAAVLFQGGDFASLLALIILLALFGLAAIGLAGVVLIVQARIYEDGSIKEIRQTMKSATLLTLAGLFPLIGWFVLTPIVLLCCLGAVIMVLVRRQKQEAMSGP